MIIAYNIGTKQNIINDQLGKLQDVVEIHGALLLIETKDQNDNKVTKPYICIQNVGTRIIYLDSYTFNGIKYQLNGHILASTYSQTLANYYQIELPTNNQTHVSLSVRYKDQDNRTWETDILAKNNASWGWKISPYPKKLILVK
ncbi:MAG: hypothetical protein AAB550_01235 [Patescibacteria group bacterium]